MSIKVAILEENNIELGVPQEYQLSAFDVLPTDAIPLGDTWTIPSGEQLLLVNNLTLEGNIVIEGTLGVL